MVLRTKTQSLLKARVPGPASSQPFLSLSGPQPAWPPALPGPYRAPSRRPGPSVRFASASLCSWSLRARPFRLSSNSLFCVPALHPRSAQVTGRRTRIPDRGSKRNLGVLGTRAHGRAHLRTRPARLRPLLPRPAPWPPVATPTTSPPPPPAAAISRPPGPLRSVRRAGSESVLGPSCSGRRSRGRDAALVPAGGAGSAARGAPGGPGPGDAVAVAGQRRGRRLSRPAGLLRVQRAASLRPVPRPVAAVALGSGPGPAVLWVAAPRCPVAARRVPRPRGRPPRYRFGGSARPRGGTAAERAPPVLRAACSRPVADSQAQARPRPRCYTGVPRAACRARPTPGWAPSRVTDSETQ